jgi:hypothetical protein
MRHASICDHRIVAAINYAYHTISVLKVYTHSSKKTSEIVSSLIFLIVEYSSVFYWFIFAAAIRENGKQSQISID